MKNFFQIDAEDKILWTIIAIGTLIYVVAFSIFWQGGVFYHLEKAFAVFLVIFLPGFVIMKLFLDHISISEHKGDENKKLPFGLGTANLNRISDKAMLSFGLSIASMIVPYYLTTYIRPYVFNTDEEGWGLLSNTSVTIILLLLVLAVAFGVKFYQNKKKGLV